MSNPQAEPPAQALGDSLAALAVQVAALRGQVGMINQRLDQAGLRGDFHVVNRRMRLRNRLAYFPHCLEVRNQGVLEVAARLLFGLANRYTPGHIR